MVSLLILPAQEGLSIQHSLAHLHMLHFLPGTTTHMLMAKIPELSERAQCTLSR